MYKCRNLILKDGKPIGCLSTHVCYQSICMTGDLFNDSVEYDGFNIV